MLKKKKMALCVLNSKYIHSSLAPWCLYTSAKEKCSESWEFTVIEGTVNEKTEDVYRRIIAENPDTVSFSCYIWNIEKTLLLSKMLKEHSKDIAVILGGPEVAYNQKEILINNHFVDYVFSGEGEIILPSFLLSLSEARGGNIPGVSFRKDGEITVSSATEGDSDYPSPYCPEYFQSLKGRIAYIESSRGCPYSCAFCLSGRCGRVRFFPLERVKNEMLSLCENGAKTIKFVDRTFNANPKRAKEILSFIKENYGRKIDNDVCFHFEIAADIMDEDLISLIASMPTGSVQFEAGIQSFNEKTLKAIGRRNDTEKTVENIKKLISAGNCHIHIDLIAGLPYEDYDSFIKGFNRAYDIGADMLQSGFLKVLNGSPMGEEREKYPCVYSEKPPYEVISTPYISEKELANLHKAENELERLYNSGRFSVTLSYILSVTAMSAYDLFYDFALYLESVGRNKSIPLDEYICLTYDYFSSLTGVDKSVLRDKMIYDRIATNNSGVIPEKLKINDGLLKKAKKYLSDEFPLGKGTNRTVAVIYTEEKIIWCDYEKKNRVTGKYEIKTLPMNILDEE